MAWQEGATILELPEGHPSYSSMARECDGRRLTHTAIKLEMVRSQGIARGVAHQAVAMLREEEQVITLSQRGNFVTGEEN
ncbi:GntR family transcriptional regulator [Streptosporangium sp. CA-135522]|uniref:GntR family transcriptional regulator n=1 Tax=Streptosporangium sp. CA-135522 TaxID=3240072 RepID=UPI003D8BAD04